MPEENKVIIPRPAEVRSQIVELQEELKFMRRLLKISEQKYGQSDRGPDTDENPSSK